MNKDTMNLLTLFIVVIVIVVGLKYLPNKSFQNESANTTNNTITGNPITGKDTSFGASRKFPIYISEEDIKEQNFTGKKSLISGSGIIVESADKFIDQEVSSFKTRADKEVPDMIKEFGSDSPTGKYYIGLEAKYIKGDKAESIVVSEYMYTGGANGMSTYKVFTSSMQNGKLLSLADILDGGQTSSFIVYMKQKLTDWRPYGMTESVVFSDSINTLTLDSFSNWSMDNNNLTIYFDKYEIGAGALGAVSIPLPLTEIETYLKAF